jgi:ATP-binding cassette subfamily B protein
MPQAPTTPIPKNGQRIPEELQQLIKQQAITVKEPVICVCSHMTLNADFGKTWLAIGDKRLSVIKNSDGFKVAQEVELDQLTGAKTLPFIGGGALTLEVKGKTREVLRFPASQARLFGAIAGNLQKTARKKTPEEMPPVKPAETPEKPEDKPKEKPPDPEKPKEEPISIDAAMKLMKVAVDEELDRNCGRCGRQYPKHTKVCPFCVSHRRVLFRIFTFAKPYRYHIAAIALMMTLGTAMQLIPPRLSKLMIDRVLNGGQLDQLSGLLGLMLATMVGQAGLNAFRARLSIWVGARVTNSIRNKAYTHLQTLSMSYFEKRQIGALMSRVSHDTQNIEGFLVEGVQFTIINILLAIGIAVMLLLKNPFLGMLVLLPIPIVILISRMVWRKIMVAFRKWWDSVSRMNALLSDTLSGTREIKATGQEQRTVGRFEERSNETANRTIIAETSWQTMLPALNLLIQLPTILIWYFGAHQVNDKSMTLGDLFEFIALMSLMYGPIQLLTRLNDWVARSSTAAERVFELIDTQPDIVDALKPTAMSTVAGRVEMRDIAFGYEKHKPVIKNISLDIVPGQMVGLVGKSGSGKSTLIKLIMRLYDVDSGEILIDGTDIRQLSREEFHRQVAVVLQDPFMFNGSIAENIAFARPDATPVQIIQAATAANAHEFIMKLPNGYDNQVGERGTKLSGGERQRIAIARALVMDPKILILDEATSSVDTETEQKIQQALERLIKGRTTIAIAHRLSTLRHANHLVVLEDGQVKEKGSHDELMAKDGGVYRKLVEIQTEWARTVAVGA